MKEIPLSHGLTAKVSDEDFDKLSQRSWSAYRIAAKGRGGKIYLYGFKAGFRPKVNGKRINIWMHNVIMTPPLGYVVDHKDGDPLNNTRENLRIVSVTQNSMNRGKRSNGKTSKYLGVCKRSSRRRFSAQIKLNNKIKHLGYFDDEVEAAKAYDQAAREAFKEFARLNFPDSI